MRALEQKEVLTTGEVARICHVAPRTVSKWFDTGQLRGYRIPGSRDRRIPRQQLTAFMRAHGIPMDRLDDGCCRVLIVDPDVPDNIAEAMSALGRYEVCVADNGFQAGIVAQQFSPNVVVLGVGDDHEEALAICRNVHQTPALRVAKVVALVRHPADELVNDLLSGGFDACLAKPYSPRQLAEELEKETVPLG